MADDIHFISQDTKNNYELKKCHESVDRVGLNPHPLRDDVILNLGGKNHIEFTLQVAKILIKNKVNIFDIFSIFRDLKYDYDNGMYSRRLRSVQYENEVKSAIKKAGGERNYIKKCNKEIDDYVTKRQNALKAKGII